MPTRPCTVSKRYFCKEAVRIKAEEKYPSYELEVLAIVKALKRFCAYLLGIKFKIITDCRAFAQTMTKRDLCVRVARWALLLEEFQYEIEHRPGKNMAHVDALSQNPLPMCLVASECERGMLARLKKAQSADNNLKEIFKAIERDHLEGYLIRGGLLYKEDNGDIRLVVPKAMQSQVIRKTHEQGHFGIVKTEALVRKDYWIPNLRLKVEGVWRNCIPCILAERKHGKAECFLSPIGKGDTPLDTFHIDYLGPLQSTKKKLRSHFCSSGCIFEIYLVVCNQIDERSRSNRAITETVTHIW